MILGVAGGIVVMEVVALNASRESWIASTWRTSLVRVAYWRWRDLPGLRISEADVFGLQRAARDAHLRSQPNLQGDPGYTVAHGFADGFLAPSSYPVGSGFHTQEQLQQREGCELRYLLVRPVSISLSAIEMEVSDCTQFRLSPDCSSTAIGISVEYESYVYNCRRAGSGWRCLPRSSPDA